MCFPLYLKAVDSVPYLGEVFDGMEVHAILSLTIQAVVPVSNCQTYNGLFTKLSTILEIPI
jgi:hypothetical protein